MQARLIAMDVTEPEVVDKKIGETPDISQTPANTKSVLGNTAGVAVAGIAGTLGMPSILSTHQRLSSNSHFE